jgi:membrane-bound serine protease (ClpP class)
MKAFFVFFLWGFWTAALSWAGQESYAGKVVIIPVGQEDLVIPARFEFMSRALKRCSDERAEAVIFDLDTPGGLLWDTVDLMMKDLQELEVRSLAFVNPRALSAGAMVAMVAMATDAVYMAPASSIGAATPIYGDGKEMDEATRAKMNSATMGMARAVIKRKGHDPQIIEAMIDMSRKLEVNGKVLDDEKSILTLDAEQATLLVNGKPLLAKGIVKNVDEIKKAEGLKGASVTAEPVGFENIAIWVTRYASLLILIGIAAGYLEMKVPGFGVPGLISLLAFSVFFFGHYVAGSLVGNEALVAGAVFLLGVFLILLEVFFLPGTLVAGLVGFACVIGALIYTMAGWEYGTPPAAPDGGPGGVTLPGLNWALLGMAFRQLALGFLGGCGVIALMARFLPGSRPFRALVLASSSADTAVARVPAQQALKQVQVGDVGVTVSALRPYGTVRFAAGEFEASSGSEYVLGGVPVVVREVQGTRVRVAAVAEEGG